MIKFSATERRHRWTAPLKQRKMQIQRHGADKRTVFRRVREVALVLLSANVERDSIAELVKLNEAFRSRCQWAFIALREITIPYQ